MFTPVSFVELHSPDLDATRSFMVAAFGWDPQPFASNDYFVAPAGTQPGIDAGLTMSQDGLPRVVPVINVASLDQAITSVTDAGGSVVVPAFTISGVGRGCYVTDPVGVLIGLHQNDPTA